MGTAEARGLYRVEDDMLELGDWVTGYLLAENFDDGDDGSALAVVLTAAPMHREHKDLLYTPTQIRQRIA